jgi:hypothetical protein
MSAIVEIEPALMYFQSTARCAAFQESRQLLDVLHFFIQEIQV